MCVRKRGRRRGREARETKALASGPGRCWEQEAVDAGLLNRAG